MKRAKNYLCCFLAIVLVTFALVGCATREPNEPAVSPDTPGAVQTPKTDTPAPKPAEPEQPFKGTTINFLGFGARWTNTIVEAISDFETKTGIKVNFEQLANDQLSQRIAISSAAGGRDLDVFAFRPLQETLLFVQNGWLESLDTYIAKSPDFVFEDFFMSSKEVSTRDGKTYGIPVMTEREIVYYNKELFEKANVEIPNTLDELMEAARALNDPANGIAGIAIRGRGHDAVTQFSGFLYSFGGDFIKDGKAVINTPEAIQAFQFYGDLLRNYGPPGVLNMGWVETQSLFTQGRAAMRIDADSQFGFAMDPKSSLIHDKLGFFTFPAGPAGAVPYNIVAWCLGISSGSQNKDAAWEFIKWSMGKEMDKKAALNGNPSTRMSTWANPDAIVNFPKELVSVINETNPIARGIDRPFMINVGEARTIIGNVIMEAIAGRDVEAAANAANIEFQKLLDEEKN